MELSLTMQLSLDKNQKIIAYKLLHDLLFVILFFFFFALLGEGMLPGIVASHIGLYKIAIGILAIVVAIEFLAQDLGLRVEQKMSKKTAIPLLVVLAALVINSLLRLDAYLIALILGLCAAIAFILYRLFFPTKK